MLRNCINAGEIIKKVLDDVCTCFHSSEVNNSVSLIMQIVSEV